MGKLDELMGKDSSGEEFDFMGEDTVQAGDETATGGNPKSEYTGFKNYPQTKVGVCDLEATLEARKRADSPRGLDIEQFLTEYKISGSVDIEHLLHGPLPSD